MKILKKKNTSEYFYQDLSGLNGPYKTMKHLKQAVRRKALNQVREDCGLVCGKDSMGRTIWE